MRNAIRGWLMTWIVAAGCLGAMSARAVGPEVRDNAGLFSAQAVKQADERIRRIQQDVHKELLVEAFAGVPEGRMEEYARHREEFFASLVRERAQAARLDGIYVLVMKEPPPRRFRIQVGVGQATQQRGFSPANRDELVRMFQTNFRVDKYDEGLGSAVAYVERTLRVNLSGAAAAGTRAAVPGTPPEPSAAARRLPATNSQGLSPASLIITGMLVVGGIVVVVVLLRLLRGGMGGGRMAGQPGWGGGGGGGGFFSSLLGSIGGVMAGSWLYDHFFNSSAHASGSPPPMPTDAPSALPSDVGGDFTSSGGDVSDMGGGDVGGGDFGGGGFDGGGGDFGGGGGGDA